MEKSNLLKDDEKKIFYHYLIPSICSTLVTSIYILVDTLIIGQGVGAEGICALNIFLPFFAVYNGIGLMFGLGGGILISMEDGMGNKEESYKYFISSLVAVVIIGLIFTILTNIFLEEISYFLGSNENTSIFISVIRGFLLNIILVLSLPIVFGGFSLWFVVPTTEVITLFGIIIYISKLKSSHLNIETKFNKVAIAK